jgi:hypothetical protein
VDIAAVEEQYLARARTQLGSRLEGIGLVLPDRSAAPPDSDPALAGWWVDEAAAGERVVLPNPYETVEIVAAMEASVWGVVQGLAPALGERLDAVSGRQAQPPEYWCTVLAPWLIHTVSALADRRLFCRAASDLAPAASLMVPAPPEPPATAAEAVLRLRTDAGNAGLLASLAPRLGVRTAPIPPGAGPGANARPPSHPPLPGPPFRTLAAAASPMAVGAALAALPRRRVAVVGLTRLTATDLVRLGARMRGLSVLPRPDLRRGRPGAAVPAADEQLRSALALPAGDEPLQRLTATALPQLLPRSLVEGFDQIRSESRRRYGRPLPALVGNYSTDEVQNEFLGRCRAAGRRLAFAQHGGFYLQSPVNAQERLELEPDSAFLSWGGRGRGAVPTPNPHLERLRGSHQGGTRITIVEPLEPPDAYVLRFAGQPLANQAYEPARMLAELVERLPPARRALVALKHFPNVLGPAARPAVLEALPSDGPAGGAAAWMAASRLAVIPYLDTPLIESIVIGTPTVGLWNPVRWPLLGEVEPLFARLRELRIIHADPAAAAAHIDAVYDDVDSWWDSADVTSARGEFVERMAIAGDWPRAWSARLRELRRRRASSNRD